MSRPVVPKEVVLYEDVNGVEPVTEWLSSLKDERTFRRIRSRLRRLELGNLGEYRVLGDGVSELKLDFGPGYRVYFSEVGNQVVLLLCGGDKQTQSKDIEQAKKYLEEYKELFR